MMAKLATQEAERLNTWIGVIAQSLRPKAHVQEHAGGSLRLGTNGSLLIGPTAGMWYDFEAGKGGVTALTLIEHHSDNKTSPKAWAKEFLKGHPGNGNLDLSSDAAMGVAEDAEAVQTPMAEHAGRVLSEAVDPLGTPVEIYLQSRGLESPYPETVKYLNSARTGEGAVVAIITDDLEKPVAVHLTYITPEGKKSTVVPQRRTYPLVSDWASRGLFRTPAVTDKDLPERLVLAEGMEDALSLWRAGAGTVVAGTTGVSYFGKVTPKKDLPVVIFRDGDKPDSPAETALRAGVDRLLLAGARSVAVTPTPEGQDANDILRTEGPERVLEITESAEQWELSPEGRVEALSRLRPLEYDQCRKRVARELGIRVGVLDEEVRQHRSVEEDENAQNTMCEEVVPWPAEVKLADVLDEGVAALQLYVHLTQEAATTVLLWAAHAFVHHLVSVSPRLAIQSPEKGCGKTTLLEALALMVPKQVSAASISTASVFRLIEAVKPTLLLDEADQLFRRENADLLAVLNSSHRKASAYVIRTVEVSPGQFVPTLFSTYAPVAFAGIRELPPTLQDRSLIIRLERALPGEVHKHLEDGFASDLASTGRKLARWAQDVEKLPRMDLSGVDGLHNRAGDNWRPLIGIADLAGGDWPGKALKAAMRAVAASMDEQGVLVRLLYDIKDAFGSREKMTSREIVDSLLGLEDGPYRELRRGREINQNWLARQLKGAIKGTSHTIRDGQKTPKGYERAQFESAWARYTYPDTPEMPATTATPQQLAENRDSQADKSATNHPPQRNPETGGKGNPGGVLRGGGTGVADSTPENPQNTRDYCGVALVSPNPEGAANSFPPDQQRTPDSEVL